MAKVVLKTQENELDPKGFIDSVADERQRADSLVILELMKRATGEAPKMWGPSIIGFGKRTLKYDSGREMDWMITGFSPRKANMTLYIMDGFDRYDELLASLGKYKTGKSCLYIKRLSEVDLTVLETLVTESVAYVRSKDV
jgi:hypothetical protein